MNLRPYQHDAVEAWRKTGRLGLFFECGLGKTLVAIRCIELYLKRYPERSVLIVAPKSVCLSTWPAEISKWAPTTIRYFVGAGQTFADARTMASCAGGAVFIVNFEKIAKLHKAKVLDHFDFVIVDESSRIKSPKAQSTKTLLKMASTGLTARMIMSGTPAPNGDLTELYTQIKFLDDGERLGKTLTAFRSKFCSSMVQQFGSARVVKWLVKDPAVIHRRCEGLCRSVRAKDHLDLEQVDVNHDIKFTYPEKRAYKTLKQESILTLINANDVAFTTGVIINRLCQYTSGWVYHERNGYREAERVSRAKIDFLKDLLDDITENAIIAYNYKFEERWLRENGVEMLSDSTNWEETIKDWNAGKIQRLAVHPQSAGHGLNLQHGGHHLIWLSLPWSYENYGQTIARLLRSGQENPVMVHHLLVEGTVDDYVLSKLRGKEQGNSDLLNHLRQ